MSFDLNIGTNGREKDNMLTKAELDAIQKELEEIENIPDDELTERDLFRHEELLMKMTRG